MNLDRVTCCLLAALGAAGGCTSYSTAVSIPVDCNVESAYEFDVLTRVPPSNAYSAGSLTVGASSPAPVAETIPEGMLCGATTALVIRAAHNNDWGSLVGFYGLGMMDESAFQGVSFWARAPGGTNKGFTLALDDANTYSAQDAGTNCTDYGGDGGTNNPGGTIYDPSTNMPISGVTTNAPPADACGNSYSLAMTVTTGWRLYTFPFTEFHQAPMPNRVPNAKLMEEGGLPGSGLLTNKIMNIVFRMPREANTELWVTKLTFYRKGTGDTQGDGSVAAP